MNDDYIKAVSAMVQKRMKPKIKKEFNKLAAESLGISQEEHDRIVDELIYGKEPELVDVDDLPKEVPVSEIDFEQELYKAFGHVKDFTLCLKIARRFYEMGRKYHEPISEDFEKIVEEIAEPTILNAYGTKELARRLRNTICGTSVSEDLEQAIDTYLATYFGGEKEKQDWPFLKKMAIHFAKWQKEQMMAKVIA